jgi:hypothetical protein
MTCNIPVQNNVKTPDDCKCYKAVMRTYQEMVDAGEPEVIALEAAKIVYGYHHPEDSALGKALTVERWTSEERLH